MNLSISLCFRKFYKTGWRPSISFKLDKKLKLEKVHLAKHVYSLFQRDIIKQGNLNEEWIKITIKGSVAVDLGYLLLRELLL